MAVLPLLASRLWSMSELTAERKQVISNGYPTTRPTVRARCARRRLREHYQQLHPFQFIVHSELAGADLLPAPD